MPKDNVVRLIQPRAFEDQLTEVLRNGARALLAQAVEAEVASFHAKHVDLKTEDGRQRVVRHGHLPEREVMAGIGPVAVRQPRVRDREAAADDPGRVRFSPTILPPYLRRSKSIETLLPVLYLKGISTGDFSEALGALQEIWGRRPSPRLRWTPSAKATRSSTRRPPIASPRIATGCWRSTSSRPSTGSICASRTRSRARSRPCAIAPFARKAASRTKPCSPWCSSLSGARKSWRRLDGHNQLPKLILAVTFADGLEVAATATR